MSTTLRRASARLLVLPLLASLSVLGPSETASAQPARAQSERTSALLAGERLLDSRDARLRELARAERLEARRRARAAADAERREAAVADRAQLIISAAAAQAGKPYVWGATGPSGFDCSGLTGWAYAAAGIELPRTSDAQAAATYRVSEPQLGDLVFFANGGDVYHVGIYAGDGQMWHAPRPGRSVAKEAIWTTSGLFYGRIG